MAVLFLDSSALLKLYLSEKGATWLKSFVSGQQIVISELAIFETANVLRRLYVEGHYTRDETSDLIAQINRDSATYEVVPVSGSLLLNRLITTLLNLPITLRIRSLDSIHLTSALIALEAANTSIPPEPFVFVSSDVQLLRVAQAQGFVTENPEDHP